MQSPFSLVNDEKGFDRAETKAEVVTDHTVRILSGREASSTLRDTDAAEESPSHRCCDVSCQCQINSPNC